MGTAAWDIHFPAYQLSHLRSGGITAMALSLGWWDGIEELIGNDYLTLCWRTILREPLLSVRLSCFYHLPGVYNCTYLHRSAFLPATAAQRVSQRMGRCLTLPSAQPSLCRVRMPSVCLVSGVTGVPAP